MIEAKEVDVTVLNMHVDTIYILLERVGSLLRSDARIYLDKITLQPVHLEVLHYLSNCNRFSNTPIIVADYLGLTKGTVSQSIKFLEANGLLVRYPDRRDRRVVHLALTTTALGLLDMHIPSRRLINALSGIHSRELEQLGVNLQALLGLLQKNNGLKSYGKCHSCEHYTIESDSASCNLYHEKITGSDASKICFGHKSS